MHTLIADDTIIIIIIIFHPVTPLGVPVMMSLPTWKTGLKPINSLSILIWKASRNSLLTTEQVLILIGYDNKTTQEVLTTKFHGFEIDNNLNWKKSTLNIQSPN
jgi:hypothetical protein